MGGRAHSKANVSQKRAEAALIMLLTGCRRDRLANFTADGLAKSYNVSFATAERMLNAARQGTLL